MLNYHITQRKGYNPEPDRERQTIQDHLRETREYSQILGVTLRQMLKPKDITLRLETGLQNEIYETCHSVKPYFMTKLFF